MAYVYMISHYDEYGSDDVSASLSKDGLFKIINAPSFFYSDESRLAVTEKLKTLFELRDIELAGKQKHDLQKGWGGFQLHVVELDVART